MAPDWQKRHMKDAPVCPNCARPMVSVKVLPRCNGFPALHTFECRACGVVFTEVDSGPAPSRERVLALNLEASPPMQ
jgi:hypothetical protein